MKKREKGERKIRGRGKDRKREVENELHYTAHLIYQNAVHRCNVHKTLLLVSLLISSLAERKYFDENDVESDVVIRCLHFRVKKQLTTDGAYQHTAWCCIYVFNVCVYIWRAGFSYA